jgi:hypothetical protein
MLVSSKQLATEEVNPLAFAIALVKKAGSKRTTREIGAKSDDSRVKGLGWWCPNIVGSLPRATVQQSDAALIGQQGSMHPDLLGENHCETN